MSCRMLHLKTTCNTHLEFNLQLKRVAASALRQHHNGLCITGLLRVPHVTRHTSHVTRHTSHVTRHTPHRLPWMPHRANLQVEAWDEQQCSPARSRCCCCCCGCCISLPSCRQRQRAPAASAFASINATPACGSRLQMSMIGCWCLGSLNGIVGGCRQPSPFLGRGNGCEECGGGGGGGGGGGSNEACCCGSPSVTLLH